MTKTEHTFIFNNDNFEMFLKRITDLGKIHTMVKVKMDSEHILLYARGGDNNTIPAFKSIMFPIDDIMTASDYPNLDFIILNSGNFVKNSMFYVDKGLDIAGKFNIVSGYPIASQLFMTNKKLNVNFVSGDYTQIKDITKQQIEDKMDPALANFSFDIPSDTLNEVRKLAVLNDTETINIKVKKNKLSFYDKRWSMEICDVNHHDENFVFNKKYLKSIEMGNTITCNMFDTFMLFKENNINLMIGFELSDIK